MAKYTASALAHSRFPRVALLAALGVWLACAGGCAMVPFALTTTASLAMPQTASLAMSGVKGAYNTAMLARDERDVNTIVRDNMLSLKAKSAMLTLKGGDDVQVLALNGDLFAVGTVETPDERDEIINAMHQVQGVGEVKGHLRLRDPESSPSITADDGLENSAHLALSRHLLHKNAGVEVRAVEGELCLMGVVGTHAEALDLIQYLESVTGARVMSLLAIRNEYATGRTETNQLYLLAPSDAAPFQTTMLNADAEALPGGPISVTQATLAQAAWMQDGAPYAGLQHSGPRVTASGAYVSGLSASGATSSGVSAPVASASAVSASAVSASAVSGVAGSAAALPRVTRNTPGEYRATVIRPLAVQAPLLTPRIAAAPVKPHVAPAQAAAPTWNKARAHMQHKLIGLAQRVQNPQARAELLTLAGHVAQDRDVSISDRLSVAAAQATQAQAKTQIEALLALY